MRIGRFISPLLLVALVLLQPIVASAEPGDSDSSERRPIVNIKIDFQGIIDGIVNGLNDILNNLFFGLPDLLWKYFFNNLLLKPLGLDDPDTDNDIVSTTGFFLTRQPNLEPFRLTIEKLSELLILLLAFGVIAASVKALWEILTSEEPSPIESTIKREVLPLFLGAFALSLSVEIYQLVLYIAQMITQLFMVNVDYLIFRNLSLSLISLDLLGLLGVALIFLFTLFLLFTYLLELVNAFLLPIFITLRALPFDITRAIGQSGINFVILNAFMPAFSALMIFIATSIWSSADFWDSLALNGYALFLTKKFLAMIFLILAVHIPVFFYFTTFAVPVIRYAIGYKILKGVIPSEKAGISNMGHNSFGSTQRLHPAQRQLRSYYR